jgi:hypothetical protein
VELAFRRDAVRRPLLQRGSSCAAVTALETAVGGMSASDWTLERRLESYGCIKLAGWSRPHEGNRLRSWASAAGLLHPGAYFRHEDGQRP